MSDSSRFDTIIIGAGTAGSLLAKRLTEGGKRRVLLLEAGSHDRYHWVHIPVGYLYCIGNPRTDWLYQTEPDAGLNGRRLRYPRGKVLGGCTSINGMIYMRGQSRDYDHWADLTGDAAWSWAQCVPDFTAHEDHYKLDAATAGNQSPANASANSLTTSTNPSFSATLHGNRSRGSTGEWRVEKQRLHWPILDAFVEAAQQAGIRATDDFNGGTNEGVGYFEVNQKQGVRWNATKAFLAGCEGRANFTLWTQAHVAKLLVEATPEGQAHGARCTGVQVWRDGSLHNVHADQVVLCAGAVGSPHLMQLSGIGPAQWLHERGIPVVHDLPGVGENLQDHLQIRAVYKVQGVQTLNTLANSLVGKARIGLQYLLTRSGPMSMAPSQLGAFTRSSPELAWPDLEFHVQPLSLEAFGEPLHPFDAFTASVCNLNPTSRGHVRAKSANFRDAPAIAPHYLSTESDRLIAANSLRVVRNIVNQPALAQYQPQEFKPGTQYQSDAELWKLAGDIATTIFHPVGTTKMGRADDPMAVVDSRLNVRGVAGLQVVDAGVMPTITSGNTASPTLMIAEKAARWMVEGR
jgi:choline dehydrogenase